MVSRAALLVAVTLLAACMTPQPVPLPLPPTRYQQKGFSFVPLDEPGWVIAVKEPEQIVLGSRGRNPDETNVLQGVVEPLPESKSFDDVVAGVLAAPEAEAPGRYTMESSGSEPAPSIGEKCVRVHQAAKDSGAVHYSGNPETMVIELWAIVCPSPDDPATFILFGYSSRYFASQRVPEMETSAAKALDSFQLTRAQPGGG